MSKSVVKVLAACSAMVSLVACSSGGGGGGTGGGTASASGALSVPNLNCGNASCFSMNTGLMPFTGLNSAEEIADYGETVYNHFNTVSLPKINQMLYSIEQAFKANGAETCADIVSAPDTGGTPMSLSGGYTVHIGTENPISSPFGGTTSKYFLLSLSETPVAFIRVGCAGTVRHMYVKVIVDTNTRYEVWVKADSADSNVKSIEAAADSGGSKMTLWFESSSATAFSLAAVGKDYPNPYQTGSTVSFSIVGAANLGVNPKIASIGYTPATSSAPPQSYSAVNASWDGATALRHCYSNFSLGTVDAGGAACTSLGTPATSFSSGVRGHSGSISWQVDNFASDIAGIIL